MTESPVGDVMFDALRQVPGAITRTYLAPDVKVMFESINKNACTSLKWMMADLVGEDLDRFRAGRRPFVSDSEAVHDRKLWIVSPRLDSLTPAQRSRIHPANGWFIFAVVRDPRLRLFSAWQNKLLIETPSSQKWRNEPWYPRHPITRESVIEDFAHFVTALEKDPNMWLRVNDPHFRDQIELLAEDAIPYSRIYEIHEIKKLEQDLTAHLVAQGRPHKLLISRANPTPLHASPEVFDNGVRKAIERIYAADFERFGSLWDFAKVESASPWTDSELARCESESELGLRVSELYDYVIDNRQEREAARDEILALKGRITRLEKNLAEVTGASESEDSSSPSIP